MESDAERTRCISAKEAVKLQKADFANKYFYIFGLNLKFCRGIQNYKKALNETSRAEQERKVERVDTPRINFASLAYLYYFDMWLESRCSKPVESKIWTEIQRLFSSIVFNIFNHFK